MVVTGPNHQKLHLQLKKIKKETILELEQINVPDEQFEDIDIGWDEYYLGPMKEMLENNS